MFTNAKTSSPQREKILVLDCVQMSHHNRKTYRDVRIHEISLKRKKSSSAIETRSKSYPRVPTEGRFKETKKKICPRLMTRHQPRRRAPLRTVTARTRFSGCGRGDGAAGATGGKGNQFDEQLRRRSPSYGHRAHTIRLSPIRTHGE